MLINQMTESDCREVLARVSTGRLGCSLDNQPYVVPVYFAYEPDYFYVFSTLGQTIEWMRANPKACMEADGVRSESGWASVIATGTYQELSEPQCKTECEHARRQLGQRHRWWLNALAERRLTSEDNVIAPLFFRVHIDSMTGLRAVPGGEEAAA